MSNIFTIGANSFKSSNLYCRIFNLNSLTVGTVRSKKKFLNLLHNNFINIDILDNNTDRSEELNDCKYVLHCIGVSSNILKFFFHEIIFHLSERLIVLKPLLKNRSLK